MFNALKDSIEVMRIQAETLNQGANRAHKAVNIATDKMPKYNGNDPALLPDFLLKFERYRKLGDWSQEEALMRFATCLDGVADTAYRHSNYENFTMIEQAYDSLRAHFLNDLMTSSLMDRLMSLQQRDKENVAQFHRRILSLADACFHTTDEITKDRVLKGAFIRGLRIQDVREQILRKNPESFLAAVKAATSEEMIILSRNSVSESSKTEKKSESTGSGSATNKSAQNQKPVTEKGYINRWAQGNQSNQNRNSNVSSGSGNTQNSQPWPPLPPTFTAYPPSPNPRNIPLVPPIPPQPFSQAGNGQGAVQPR